MPIKRRVPLTAINGCAAGATATINMPIGPIRYHTISLAYKTGTSGGATEATMDTEITEIRLIINGVVQRRFSPAQLFNLNRQKGKTPTVSASTSIPGYLTIFLTEPQRRTQYERELTCWGMANVNSFHIEIDVASAATSPVLTGWASIDDISQPLVNIVKWKKEIIQVSATGVVNYSMDVSKPTDAYQDVTFIETNAGDITNILVNWDSLPLYQDDTNYAVEVLNDSDYTKVSAYRHYPACGNSLRNIVPTIRKDANGNIVQVGQFLAQLTMGGANNVTCIREVVGLPD